MKDPIIDRSDSQKRLRIEIMRLELKGYGYSIVKSPVLQPKALGEMMVAAE